MMRYRAVTEIAECVGSQSVALFRKRKDDQAAEQLLREILGDDWKEDHLKGFPARVIDERPEFVSFLTRANEAGELCDEWVKLYEDPNGYRPHQPEASKSFPNPMDALHHLADIANAEGLSAGDALVISIETVRRVDTTKNGEESIKSLVASAHRGELMTVEGPSIKEVGSIVGVAKVAVVALASARPEASIEYQEADPGLRQLQSYVKGLD